MTEPAIEEPEALCAALTYASRGWPVAPAHSIRTNGACTCSDPKCTAEGKHPLTINGCLDATTDPAKIRAWWAKWPHANVLIATGMVGDRCLVALDIDPRHNGDESLAKLIVEHGPLPETPMSVTGSGGQHIFMWANKAVPNSAGKAGDGRFGEGVDVRGVGGYVIAAPSRHKSGRTYEWDSGAHPAEVVLAEAPAWFVHLAGWSKKRHEARDGSDVGNNERYIVGGRNDALTRLGGAMRRVGAGLKRITDALLDENEEKCNPPLDPAEVKKIARSVTKYPSGDPSVVDADPFAWITPVDLAKELPPVAWTCEKLGIAPGGTTIIGGAGFGGKTMAMQSLMLSVASGLPVWGHFDVKRGRARHFDFEQGPRLTTDRDQRLAREMGINLAELDPLSLGVCSLPRQRFDEKSEDTIVRLCEGITVAVFDAFRGAFPTAKENDSEVRRFLDMLQAASQRTGCAMLVIAHSRKASEDDDVRSSLRGSSALFDAAQTVYMLDGCAGKPTKVHNTKDRILGETRETFGLRITDTMHHDPAITDRRWGLRVEYVCPPDVQAAYLTDAKEDVLTLTAARMGTAGERILSYLTAFPEGRTVNEVSSMSATSVRDTTTVLAELVRQGIVRVEGYGPRAVVTMLDVERQPGED